MNNTDLNIPLVVWYATLCEHLYQLLFESLTFMVLLLPDYIIIHLGLLVFTICQGTVSLAPSLKQRELITLGFDIIGRCQFEVMDKR